MIPEFLSGGSKVFFGSQLLGEILYPEHELRALRDRVFESASTDENWRAVRKNWMKPENVEWLLQQAKKASA